MESMNSELSRRTFITMAAVSSSFLLPNISFAKHAHPPLTAEEKTYLKLSRLRREIYRGKKHVTKIKFKDSIKKIVQGGAIDLGKFKKLYDRRGGLPDWVAKSMEGNNRSYIEFNINNANYLLNVLWPLGVASKNNINLKSPINKDGNVNSYASTGGWSLGKEKNGGVYFNQIAAIPLNADQERIVLEVAQNVYRPCCNNSTFFQDCNHGSALYGLLQLAASQGYSTKEMYQLSLEANKYWYPDQYTELVLYFRELKNKEISELDAKEVTSAKYFSGSGWRGNIFVPLRINKVIYHKGAIGGGGAGCQV